MCAFLHFQNIQTMLYSAMILGYRNAANKVDRLRNWVESFTALFWALGNVPANNRPRHLSTAVQNAYPYMDNGHSWFNSQQRWVCPPSLFLARYVIYCTVPLIRVERYLKFNMNTLVNFTFKSCVLTPRKNQSWFYSQLDFEFRSRCDDWAPPPSLIL